MKFWKNLFWKSIGSCEWRKLVGGTDGAPMAARWWATNRPKRPPFQLLFAKAKLDWQLDVSIMVARGWMSLAGIMWNLCRAELTGRIGCASVGCLAPVVDANSIGSWFLRRRSSARRWRGQLSNRFTWRCHPLGSHQPPVCASVSTKDLCVACQTPLNCVVRHQWKQCHFASTSFATDPLFIGHGRWHFECDAICTGRHRQPVAKLTWIEIEVSSGRWSSPHVGPPLKRNRNAIAIPLANPISQCHSPVAHQSSGRWLHKAPSRKRTSTDTVISAHPMQITTQMNHYRTPPKSGLSCKKPLRCRRHPFEPMLVVAPSANQRWILQDWPHTSTTLSNPTTWSRMRQSQTNDPQPSPAENNLKYATSTEEPSTAGELQ